jgi:hypothetical protein
MSNLFRFAVGAVAVSTAIAVPLRAQQRPLTRVDSAEKARAESAAAARGSGSTASRVLPDIGAVGDVVGDLSPDGSTQADSTRLGLRAVELTLQSMVDPRFHGDFLLRFNNHDGISIDQAYLAAIASQSEIRVGRFLMPIGAQNTTHQHDLHTTEYPWVIQQFFGTRGLQGTGVYASAAGSPLGWHQEVIVTAIDRLGQRRAGLRTAESVNKDLDGLGYSARLRNAWDVSATTDFELSGSAITGLVEQPLTGVTGNSPNAVSARQSTFGGDVTIRWRPDASHSFILQGEVMRQVNEAFTTSLPGNITYAGPVRDVTGGYVLARFQLTPNVFLAGRGDYVENAFTTDGTLSAGSGYLEWFPSEFSKFSAGFERLNRTGADGVNRILLQASFAVGSHRSHPF